MTDSSHGGTYRRSILDGRADDSEISDAKSLDGHSDRCRPRSRESRRLKNTREGPVSRTLGEIASNAGE